jgi:hypothetical protein
MSSGRSWSRSLSNSGRSFLIRLSFPEKYVHTLIVAIDRFDVPNSDPGYLPWHIPVSYGKIFSFKKGKYTNFLEYDYGNFFGTDF